MSKKILSPEMEMLNKVQDLYEKQRNKKFNYNIEDFEMKDNKWKHKTWNTWLIGGNSYKETIKIIQRYINECNKPLEERNLSFIHLAH